MESKNNCPLIQNYQLLFNTIPDELQNLSYAIYPTNPKYNDYRFIYNKLFNFFPKAIFYPTKTSDVSYLISNFIKYKLEFSIRSGGHSYEPASLSSGYIIDVKNFSKIEINNKNKTVKVGVGVKLGELINTLSKHSYITPTGQASCVGVAGLSLAGGKGLLTRLYGMVCDNIVSVKLVNYKGEILKASKKENSDLYWAIKGSGTCNYGLVTEIKLNIYKDIYCQISKFTWNWNPTQIKKVLEVYQNWILLVPKIITTDINITYNNGSATFTISFYKFDKNNFIEIDEFKGLYNPEISTCNGYYSKITDCWVSYDTGTNPPFSKMKSTMVFEKISSNGLDVMINSIEKNLKTKLDLSYQINLTQVGGEVINGDSAYFPKNAIIIITILIQWTPIIDNPNINEFCIQFVNKVYNNLVPYTSKYCFPNMTDYDIVDYMTAYYGSNKKKLINIKKKYDPNNIFNWRQSIPVYNNSV